MTRLLLTALLLLNVMSLSTKVEACTITCVKYPVGPYIYYLWSDENIGQCPEQNHQCVSTSEEQDQKCAGPKDLHKTDTGKCVQAPAPSEDDL